MTLRGLRRSLAWLRRTPLHPQWLLDSPAALVRWITPELRGTVLDIGCGDRWVERHLPDRVRYVGLDSVATGATLYRSRPDVFGDAGALPFPDDSVDAVLLLEVLEHLPDPRAALGEIARVLKPGGTLLLTMPFLYPVHDAPHDYQRYTPHGLERELAATGLATRRLEPTRHALESAGLLAALALAGSAVRALERRDARLLLAPVVAVAVPIVNLLAWLGARLLPDWDALTTGHRVVARKPA